MEILDVLNTDKLHEWLLSLQDHLKKDVSGYARNRLKFWLGWEPSLVSKRVTKDVIVPDSYLKRLAEIIKFDFDFCLVHCSGKDGIGIKPHRDAAFANQIAYGLNVHGNAKFSFWPERQATLESEHETHDLESGHLFRFNCKHLHSCEPDPDRWAINFWHKKPNRDFFYQN